MNNINNPGGYNINYQDIIYYENLLLQSLLYCKDYYEKTYIFYKAQNEEEKDNQITELLNKKQELKSVMDNVYSSIILLTEEGFSKSNIKLVKYMTKKIYNETEAVDLNIFFMYDNINKFCEKLLSLK